MDQGQAGGMLWGAMGELGAYAKHMWDRGS